MTRAYELMIILDGELDEPVAQSRLKSLSDGITAAGGTVHGKADWWGKRRFAYPINKKEDGYYVVYNLTAEGGALNDFERSLRIADDIVRHKLFRLPDAEAERRGLVSGTPAA
jgi:small subunit ribosomal protein S6